MRALEKPAPWIGSCVGCQRQAFQAMVWTQGHTVAIAVAAAGVVARTSRSARPAVPASASD